MHRKEALVVFAALLSCSVVRAGPLSRETHDDAGITDSELPSLERNPRCPRFVPPRSPIPWTLSADEVAEMTVKWGCKTHDDILRDLTTYALQQHGDGTTSRWAPISNYRVAMVAEGASGRVYLGVNLEFVGVSLAATMHGEQFATISAVLHNESRVVNLASLGDGAPCGHCRQWLNEFTDAAKLRVLGAQTAIVRTLDDLFPLGFGPDALNNRCPLLLRGRGCQATAPPRTPATLEVMAWRAALHSYVPYTKSQSGVALAARAVNGTLVVGVGGVIENAAFNPTADPFQVALVDLITQGIANLSAIISVVHAERNNTPARYLSRSREIAQAIAPHATFVHSPLPPLYHSQDFL